MSANDSEKRFSGSRLRLGALALLVIVLALVAGCGSDDNGGSGESGDGATELENKTIGYLDVFATAPIEKRFYSAFRQAATHAGWDVQLQDAAGDQGKAVSAARNFLNTGVDAIVTSSVPSEWLRPIVAEAEAKDVPLVELITKGSPGVYTGEVLEAQEETSGALAEKIIEDHPNGAEIGITYEPEIEAEVERLEGLEAALDGSNVKVAAVKEVPQIEAPATQKAVIDMLNANPNIEAFVAISSIQPSYALAGLRSAGNSKAKVYSWYADSANATLLKQNPQFAALIDSDIAQVGWIATGELLEFFSGGEIQQQQFVKAEPIIVEKGDVTPGMLKDEGPVPFDEIAPPYYSEWEDEYGIGG